MEKNQIPNSWSGLPSDLLTSVFERLGFADFERAKTVCSTWHSASRQSVPKNQIPWLILFPDDKNNNNNNNNNSCTLFNPEVKDKLYKTQDLGFEFAQGTCLATYGNWLLIRDPLYNLSIVNLFSKERISLPPLESQLGMIKIERTSDDSDVFRFSNGLDDWNRMGFISMRSPLLWIDEVTKDYIVLWGLADWYVVYAKKGDDLWKPIPDTCNCFEMAYKDHKLYFSTVRIQSFKVFDFSGEIPLKIFESSVNVGRPPSDLTPRIVCSLRTKLVVTVTGDVLKVKRQLWRRSGTESITVHKIYSRGVVHMKYERVDFLGDEAMLFDLGITVLANDIKGLKRNSIYFSRSYQTNTSEIFIFNLETGEMEPLHKFDCSPAQLSRAQWFFPSFNQKC